MKNNYIFLLLLLFSYSLAGKEVYYADKKLPIEFQFLISTIGEYPQEATELVLLDETIKNLDLSFRSMDKESRDFLLKTEIIKWLLDKSKINFSLKNFNTEILIRGQVKFEKEKSKLTSLAIWFIKSLHDDLSLLASSAHFPTLLKKLKNKSHIRDKELLKLQRQLKILLPSYIYYLEMTDEEYIAKQQPIIMNLIKHLESYTSYYLALSSKPHLKDNKLIFFTKAKASTKNKEKGVMKILKTVKIPFAKGKDENSPWHPKQDLLLLPTPDPDYVAPRKLPHPISDWALEEKQLYPLPSPYYVVPKKLPFPIKNWVEITPPKLQASPDPDADWIIE